MENNELENCFFKLFDKLEDRPPTDEEKMFLKVAKSILNNIVFSLNKYKTLEEYRERCRKHIERIDKLI